MHEDSEIINFVLSIILFIYYLFLLRNSEFKIPVFWKYAMLCIVISSACTILEEYIFYDFFDYLEHGLYMIAGLLFFVGAFRYTIFLKN